MTAIEIDGLTKRFGDVYAVRDLDMSVERGEVYGFLGPNGAGKSTTINVLLGFARPTAGQVRVFGIDPQTDPRAVRQRVGVLPEGYSLYDRLTGREHVAFAVRMKDANDDPGDVLARVGLSQDDAARKVGGYSKGMTQRLALGMALIGDPDLLILDEPSSGLDPNGMSDVRSIVQDVAETGTTVFFSSHVLAQVEAVCDRVGILNDGQLVTVDTIEGLRSARGGSRLIVSVDTVPQDLQLERIDGVRDVGARDGTIVVSITDPAVKAPVISQIESGSATVTDIQMEQASLEELFAAYTRGTTQEVVA